MKFISIILFIALSTYSIAQQALLNSPFKEGQLNPELEGQTTALMGEVIEIKTSPNGKQLYKINLRLDGIQAIWVSPIFRVAKGEIGIGSKLIFRGYIATTNSLDNKLLQLIDAPTLLLALRVDSVKQNSEQP